MNSYMLEDTNIQSYTNEYLNMLKLYNNQKRNGILIKYFNINVDNSIFDDPTSANYSNHMSGISYDIYDLTPIFVVDTVNNNLEKDKAGHYYTGETSIGIYTIKKPQINDLVIFNYEHDTFEIFRVKNISTSIVEYRKNVYFFKLDLEYAAKQTIDDLTIVDNYVYSFFLEKNILLTEFITLNEEFNKLLLLIEQLYNNNFDINLEIFYYNKNDQLIIPIDINITLYDYLCKKTPSLLKVKRKPFGILKYKNITGNKGIDIETNEIIDLDASNTHTPSNITTILDYTNIDTNVLLFDINLLLNTFIGYSL